MLKYRKRRCVVSKKKTLTLKLIDLIWNWIVTTISKKLIHYIFIGPQVSYLLHDQNHTSNKV